MRLKNFRLVLLGSALLISFGSTFAADEPQNPNATTAQTEQKNKRLWNLKDVDIRTFIHAVSDETNKNFAIDPRVTGKVTLISAKPLNTDELYLAFLSVLQVNGFVALPDDNVIKIVPDYVAKGLSSPIYNENMKKQGDAMAVSVVSLKYVPANELAGALNQFLTPSGHIAAYAPSNDLIVADRAGSIVNLMRMIAQIDQQQAGRIEMIRLHNAQAKTVVETLKSMMTSKTPAVPGAQGSMDLNLAADERTNSVLISGGSSEQRNQIHTLVIKLDQSTSRPSIATEVIYLKHLHAERAAIIVDSLIQNYLGKANVQTGATQTMQTNTPNPGSTLFNTTISGGSNDVSTGQGSGANGVYAANVGTNDINAIVSVMPKSGSSSPYVQWEESTNSLVVTAPKDLMNKIKKVITKLDIRRPQVLIEAVIAEVSEDRQKELGIQWNPSGKVSFETRFLPTLPLSFIGANGQLTSSSTPNAAGEGMSLYYKGNEIRLLIAALETDIDSDVLATPNLVTLDNEPAQIKVGSKVPFATAQIQNNPTGGNPFNFFNREDVGLVLTIDPQITPNGSIKLLIQQELSAIIPGTAGSGGNPTTSERFIRTTVMADNGQILVLGGLLLNQWSKTTNGVPFLAKIPYFGTFFRDRNNSIKKTNLMIFLRPTILYSDDDNERVSGGKYEFLRQSQLKLEKNNPFKSGYEQPVLPVEGDELILPSPFPVLASKKHLAGEG